MFSHPISWLMSIFLFLRFSFVVLKKKITQKQTAIVQRNREDGIPTKSCSSFRSWLYRLCLLRCMERVWGRRTYARSSRTGQRKGAECIDNIAEYHYYELSWFFLMAQFFSLVVSFSITSGRGLCTQFLMVWGTIHYYHANRRWGLLKRYLLCPHLEL